MNNKKPIVVIGPMKCEYTTLVEELNNTVEKKIGCYPFFEGEIDDYPVVIVNSFVGMANAACVTALAIQKYDPLCVIIQGTSGGHDTTLHQNDIVIGKNVVDEGSYISLHRDFGFGSDYRDWTYPGEELMIEGVIDSINTVHSDERLIDIAMNTKYTKGTLRQGTIGTADAWNREIDRINFLYEKLGTECEEMEGYAVGLACKHLNVPFLAIRIISNSELYPEEEFKEECGVICQEYVIDVIKNIVGVVNETRSFK